MAEKEFITKLAARTAIENYACRDCVHSNGKKCEDCEYQDCIDFINEIEAADVQPIRKWISVNDKLPEEGIDVLVFCQYYWGKGDICKEIGISTYYGRGKWSKLHIPIDAEILYWQPLPDLPETIKG